MSGVGLDTDYMLNTIYKTACVLGNTTVPFEDHIANGWNYITDNYSQFTIAIDCLLGHRYVLKFECVTTTANN